MIENITTIKCQLEKRSCNATSERENPSTTIQEKIIPRRKEINGALIW
ncbi:unnamed protein product [Acidithrix sp. C25]|nr:unnamed protein product [Acidithrix sp. C25]